MYYLVGACVGLTSRVRALRNSDGGPAAPRWNGITSNSYLGEEKEGKNKYSGMLGRGSPLFRLSTCPDKTMEMSFTNCFSKKC